MAYGLFYGMDPRDNVLCLIVLLALVNCTFGETMPIVEVQPEFLAPLENHTVTQGRDVVFTCVVNHLQSYKVAWIKSDSRAILAIHTHMIAHNPRLSVTHNGHNTWKLHIGNVQQNDSGTYMCQVNTDPMRSQMGYMKVVIPPDIMDLDDSMDSLTTEEGGNLRLRCRATGTPQPDVIWRREDGQSIILRNEHGVKRAVKTHKGEQLLLRDVLRQEMGSYLCIATNGVPPSVSKRYYIHVHFQPLIKVANQLVAAPVDSNVVLQCYVESSPKALNSWYKDNGAKLLTDDKYSMSEMPINDYAYQLNLTIDSLETGDFGSYTCSSINAFGKTEGTIRLQKLYMTKTTMSSVWNTEYLDRGSKRKFATDRQSSKYSFTAERQDSGSIENEQTSSPSTTMTRGGNSKDSKYPKFPGPAPEPAHFVPTQLITHNCGRSSRFLSLDQAGLTVTVAVLTFGL